MRYQFCVGVFFSALLCSVTSGIVLHNDNEPATRPDDAVIGRWSSNASCVAINPNYVLTVRHQGGGLGSIIRLNGISYRGAQVYNISSTNNEIDLRVVRITTLSGDDANLSVFAIAYSGSWDTSEHCLIGGFGKYRDPNNTRTGGYDWYGSSNTTLRWGDNQTAFYAGNVTVSTGYGTFVSECISADFDAPGEGASYECGIAEWDSGGGWFINDGGWKLAGISAYTSNTGFTLFRDKLYGIRVKTYYQQISTHIDNLVKISGQVTDLTGSAISYVQITSSNDYAGFTRTASNGSYELWVPNGWSGQLQASKTDMEFVPASKSYSNVSSDITGQDFVIAQRTISGTVKDESGLGIEGVSVQADSGAIDGITLADGSFEVAVPYGWTGNISPAKMGYLFDPAERVFDDPTESDVSGQDFNVVSVFNDDFNDGKISALWVLSGDNQLHLSETDNRLDIFTDVNISQATNKYTANEWRIDANESFSLKIEFGNFIDSGNQANGFIRIGKDSGNYASIAVGAEEGVKFYDMAVFENGTVNLGNSKHQPLVDSTGTMYICYDSSSDKLYLSLNGYDDVNDGVVAESIVHSSWAGDELTVETGGSCQDSNLAPGQLWLDGFTVNTGLILHSPPKTDINGDGYISVCDVQTMSAQWLSTDANNSGDIDGDGQVSLVDFAKFAQVW